jgi:hypothetical protein
MRQWRDFIGARRRWSGGGDGLEESYVRCSIQRSPVGQMGPDNEAQRGSSGATQVQNIHPARGESNARFAGGAVALRFQGSTVVEVDLEHDWGSIDDYDCEIPTGSPECDDFARMLIELKSKMRDSSRAVTKRLLCTISLQDWIGS